MWLTYRQIAHDHFGSRASSSLLNIDVVEQCADKLETCVKYAWEVVGALVSRGGKR